MSYPKYSEIPREWEINGTIYEVKFKRKIDGDKGLFVYGEADPADQEIRIVYGLTRKELFETLIHELIHCLEAEYDIEFGHKVINKLEGPLAKLIHDNFLEE